MVKRRSIKRLTQPTAGSCGQTCLAMLTGHPLEQVFKDVPDSGSTQACQLIVYLLMAGLRCVPFLQSVYVQPLPELAIVSLTWPDRDIGHWVIWANGKIIDPSPIPYEGGLMSTYLQIHELA